MCQAESMGLTHFGHHWPVQWLMIMYTSRQGILGHSSPNVIKHYAKIDIAPWVRNRSPEPAGSFRVLLEGGQLWANSGVYYKTRLLSSWRSESIEQKYLWSHCHISVVRRLSLLICCDDEILKSRLPAGFVLTGKSSSIANVVRSPEFSDSTQSIWR